MKITILEFCNAYVKIDNNIKRYSGRYKTRQALEWHASPAPDMESN